MIIQDLDPALAVAESSTLRSVALDDKYTARNGLIYLTGIQALVRLPLIQKWRDEAAGLKTAGFVSGYRGSPLGGLDEALWKAEMLLQSNGIKFQPGVNEDLALTSVWGTQQLDHIGTSKYAGVFGLWYAKGPGVDRSIDVMKHANHAGSSRHGGVLLVAGDDHGAYSSTVPHQSDHVFAASMVPVLYPANVQEYLELGIHGWAMSRFSGCFVGFKALADTVESSAIVSADPFATKTIIPASFSMPSGGLNTRLSTDALRVSARAAEELMQDYKIYAALAYCRENHLNRITVQSRQDRLGIVASGKSYMDVLEALEELGLDENEMNRIGVRIFKVAMPWPLEPDSVREFAVGLEEILVVEEKRQIVEYQLKEQLYNWRDDTRPRVIGKFDEKGEWVHPRGDWLLTSKSDFSVAQIARVIASRISRFHTSDRIKARLAFLEAKDAVLNRDVKTPPRPAYYCSGCPHNTSTKVPDGSMALAGIGCHIMATTIYGEKNKTVTHMGGEGVPWIGQAHFSDREHIFANLGDGTYFHSGSLAIRAAQSANVNITYKILFNDAVAMTGGQPVDGLITVPKMARQVAAEGVVRIAIVTEDLSRYASVEDLPAQATLHSRIHLDEVQRELRTVKGVSVIIYDQTCAAEKRRRRKKGELVDPPKRLFINEAVCEGCGDCGVQSNCTSILPVETDFGRKRTIDQSSCNKDYSCVKGFCPSFVTVTGGTIRKSRPQATASLPPIESLPEPVLPVLERPYNILVTGIGGTGVITIGALLGMAAHLESKGASVLDMTGMSQKNGSVMSHVRIAANQSDLRAQRIATGEADLVLGCDMLTVGSPDAVAKMQAGRTHALVNSHQQPPGTFASDPDWQFPADSIRSLVNEATESSAQYIDATRIATSLMGDAIATNLFMLGYAYQNGWIPLSRAAILKAVELNGVAVASNRQAFEWGRRAANNLDEVKQLIEPKTSVVVNMPKSLDAQIKSRFEYLTKYQNTSYADRYLAYVERVQAKERELNRSNRFTSAVARNLFKLMAYKDEYEVARLYVDPQFKQRISQTFDGMPTLRLNLAPPLFSRKDAHGNPIKSEFGPWIWPALHLLAKLKFLRGSTFDPFGYMEERRLDRQLVTDYIDMVDAVLETLDAESLSRAIDVASVPDQIRGFGHVRLKSIEAARLRWQEIQHGSITNEMPLKRMPAAA